MTTDVIEQPVSKLIDQTKTEVVERRVANVSLETSRHRITVAEYHHMNNARVFGQSPQIELLDGVIVDKMTQNPPHFIATDMIDDLLHHIFPRGSASGYCISMGGPITIEDRDGEPQPDAMIIRGSIRDGIGRRRTPADVALLIEVSDSSYDVDRFRKWITYAAVRIPIYWIVDLNHDRLEVHTEPTGQGESAIYTHSVIYEKLDENVSLILDGHEITKFPLIEILPIRKPDPEPAQPQ
jgi:Putative restriction endonuclease